MIRVCHVTSVHQNNDQRIFEKECCSLQENGYEVFLVAPGESFVNKGVSIVGVRSDIHSRGRRIWKLSRMIAKKAMEVDAQIYHFHDPELLPYALKLKKRGKIVIFDAHEDFPAQILQKKWIPLALRPLIAKAAEKFQNYVFKKMDAVVTVNDYIADKIRKHQKEVFVITNYPIVKEEDLQSKYSFRRTICFAGGISENAQHKLMIAAVSELNDITYTLCGSGSQEFIAQLKEVDGWQKVEFKGMLPYTELKKELGNAGMGMAVLPYNETDAGKKGTMGNTKLFEYMLAGIPVICTDFLTWKEIVEGEKCGLTVNPYNLAEIKAGIQYLLDNPIEAEKMGENGRKAILFRYNWAVEEKILLMMYRKFVEV